MRYSDPPIMGPHKCSETKIISNDTISCTEGNLKTFVALKKPRILIDLAEILASN